MDDEFFTGGKMMSIAVMRATLLMDNKVVGAENIIEVVCCCCCYSKVSSWESVVQCFL